MPTETYLKSQRLWIMHKLLMRIPGVRDKIQFMLAADHAGIGGGGLSPEQQMEIQNLRLRLTYLLMHFQNRLSSANNSEGNSAVFSISEDLGRVISEFQVTHQSALHREKQVYVERRCEIIRYCAWCLCKYGKEWMERVDVNVLQSGFHQWMTDRSAFPPLLPKPAPQQARAMVSTTTSKNTSPKQSNRMADSPTIFRKQK